MVESARNSDHEQAVWGDHQTAHIGMANHNNCFHEASFLDSSQLRVIPRHHMSYYNQSLVEDHQSECDGSFLSMDSNPPFSQIQIQNPNLVINNPNSYAINHYGVNHVDQVMMQNIAAADHSNWLPPTLEGSSYGCVTRMETRPELDNNAPAMNWLPSPTLEGSNNYGGVRMEPPPDQLMELDNNNNIGNIGEISPNLYPNHRPFNKYSPS